MIFGIEIPDTIAVLKAAIKNLKPVAFRDMDADTLALYKPGGPVPRRNKENLSKIIPSERCELLEMDELSGVFPATATQAAYPYHRFILLRGSTLDSRFQVSARLPERMQPRVNFNITSGTEPNLRSVADQHIRLYRISGDDNGLRESLNKTSDGEQLPRGHSDHSPGRVSS
ncbi:hypothetical protein HD554DRAFT_458203 [Boletus coccyginus]|nr:hypothetical protein HD554DRAFT_458203 [Boletus coccyginus]